MNASAAVATITINLFIRIFAVLNQSVSRNFVLLIREWVAGNNFAGRAESHGLVEILFIDVCQNSLTCKVHHMDKISIDPAPTIVRILDHHGIFDPAVAKDTVHLAAGLHSINGLVPTTVDE